MNTQNAKELTTCQLEERSSLSCEHMSFVADLQVITSGLLSRGLLWIQSRNITRKSTRRLQVSATVALGEKRFVSLIECDGLKFLIGGGAATVSLLAQLPPSMDGKTDNASETYTECAR